MTFGGSVDQSAGSRRSRVGALADALDRADKTARALEDSVHRLKIRLLGDEPTAEGEGEPDAATGDGLIRSTTVAVRGITGRMNSAQMMADEIERELNNG